MIRTLSVIALGAALIWPASASAQRAGGIRTTNNPGNTINRAPQGGALGTPGGPGPWVGGQPAVAAGVRPVARARQNNVRGSEIIVVPNYGYGGYPVFNGGYYGIPTFSTGFDTGYYPPGVWPSPVVTPPIYPTPYGNYPNEMIPPAITPGESALVNELARISQQLEELRNQNVAPVPVNAPPQVEPPAGARQPQEKPSVPTVLIMRDGRRIETQSYAIADQTLWVFDQGTTLRFSLSELDVDASQKENSRRGIRFLASSGTLIPFGQPQ
jgi:hypothetical protein